MENPSSASPVNAPLAITSGPVPIRLITAPLAKLDTAEQTVSTSVINPTASSDCPRLMRMEGQATPKTLSGRPKLMKAK
jgi:hypothetical protein